MLGCMAVAATLAVYFLIGVFVGLAIERDRTKVKLRDMESRLLQETIRADTGWERAAFHQAKARELQARLSGGPYRAQEARLSGIPFSADHPSGDDTVDAMSRLFLPYARKV